MTPQQRYDAERLSHKYTSTAQAAADVMQLKRELEKAHKELARLTLENERLREEFSSEQRISAHWKRKSLGIRT
jgi:regulator of replication initiation timing